MEKRKLLIADGAEEFVLALADALKDVFEICTCHDGKRALEHLRSFSPDVMLLDLMLPGLDGISLLQQAVEEGICPTVMTTSRFISDYMMETVAGLGVVYALIKPCDVSATVKRIQDLAARCSRRPAAVTEPVQTVSRCLMAMGFDARLQGYPFLKDAIGLMVKNPNQMITKELYPAVARGYHIPWKQVERNIRTLIDSAWRRRDPAVWERYFPSDGTGKEKCPSNGVIICRLSECLRTQSGEE